MNVLTINNLKKNFEGRPILKGVSLCIREGETVAILGPSGSGKSTLIRCAGLLERMDEGSMICLDKKVAWMENGQCVYAGLKELKQVRSNMGFVFQSFNLFPHFSALKNVTDAQIHVKKRTAKEAEERARALLEKMDLSHRADAYPYQLSGGEQQRLSIARALAMDPKVLFFDEPTSALDPLLTGSVLQVIRTLAEEGMTMAVVTHEINFARSVADRIVFILNGVVEEEGPASILDNPSSPALKEFLSGITK